AEGARRILAGEPLDLANLMIGMPPEDLLWNPPRSAIAMHLRFEAIARFHADPEAAIRRYAARIAIRATVEAGATVVATDDLAPCAEPTPEAPPQSRPSSGERIRAPPQGGWIVPKHRPVPRGCACENELLRRQPGALAALCYSRSFACLAASLPEKISVRVF